MTSSLPTGLRERKKARTRAAIREHAMRLFEEQGFAATTVDQIAEAADVSQSTVFRYFPTKEDLVLIDDYDLLIADAVRAQPGELGPVEAIRLAIRQVVATGSAEDWAQERRRQAIFHAVPELRARAMVQFASVIELLAEVIAQRAGLPADNFSARVIAGAVIGAGLAAAPGGLTGGADEVDFDAMDRALTLLQTGLPLQP